MELTARWPQLTELLGHAHEIGELELWAFGSMLWTTSPSDLDVAVIYRERRRLVGLRDRAPWELTSPPIDLIGFTPDEERELAFLAGVHGARLG